MTAQLISTKQAPIDTYDTVKNARISMDLAEDKYDLAVVGDIAYLLAQARKERKAHLELLNAVQAAAGFHVWIEQAINPEAMPSLIKASKETYAKLEKITLEDPVMQEMLAEQAKAKEGSAVKVAGN